MRCSRLLALLAMGMAACVGGTDVTEDLSLVDDGDRVHGALERDDGAISFEAVELAPETFELVYEANGLTFTYLVDRGAGVVEMDGFTTATGEDTQFTSPDNQAMHDLAIALDGLGADVSELVGLLRRVASGMAEFPASQELRQQVFAEADRDYTSICWAENSYQSASHDCDVGDWWTDNTTLDYAYVSFHAAGPCNDGTYFWNGSSWQCYEPNHSTSIEYAYGNCLGRCGAGCGSDTQLTWDCLDHDECVRTGHDLASWWCGDQFISTSDDWASAPDCH